MTMQTMMNTLLLALVWGGVVSRWRTGMSI